MDSSLLATKIRVPTTPHQVVYRFHLVGAIESAIPLHRLIVVAAPAGYGKTTLLAQWARSSRFPIAWLSLDRQDNDFERFFRYLLAAWETIRPDLLDTPLGLLLGGISPDQDAVLAAFINAAVESQDEMVFVLDDCHLIDDAAIYQALGFLLDRLPPHVHFVIAGRAEPPLPLARYRARRALFEVRTADLAFQVTETSDLLRDHLHLDLPQDEIVALQTGLEGWVAGLQLIALSLRQRPETAWVSTLSGRHRFIADYLSEDVVAGLSTDLRRFLLQTSILDTLSGSLCDAVTERTDSQGLLERLEREHVFLLPLDDDREWFRYHRLFADFLRQEGQRDHPGEVIDLHRRAARWYLDHQMPEQAFQHAVDGDAPDLVMEIAEAYFAPKLFGGEVKIVEQWLAAIPPDWYSRYPTLGLAQAIFLIITGNTVQGLRCLNEVEGRLREAGVEDESRQMAKVAMLRCAVACFENNLSQAETFAEWALRDLSEDDLSFRADTYHALGDTYRRNGRWDEARTCYLQVLELPPEPATPLRTAHVLGAMADLELQQGKLRQAETYWRQAIAAIQDRHNWGRIPLPVSGWFYLRMGELLYEWNDLDAAWDYVERGLRRAELGGDRRALAVGYVTASRLKRALGDLDAADTYLEQARPLVEQAPSPEWAGQFARCQVENWLARDQVRSAVEWADAVLEDETMATRPEREHGLLTVAYVLIVRGDDSSIARAAEILNELAENAGAGGRIGIQIETLALRALISWQTSDRVSALRTIEGALRLAEPEGYVRLFADLGLPIARLLQEVRGRQIMPDYLDKLLAAIAVPAAFAIPAVGTLPEPLSPREQDVLALIAAGLTNREIAEQLVIAPETVKKHTGNILGKLGVSNRTEAAAKARTLHLLT